MKKTIIALMALAGIANAGSYTWNGGETITSDAWKNQDNWVLSQGTVWTSDSNGPLTSGSNMWEDVYISGASGTVSHIVEGWSLDVHLSNNTHLTLNRITKFQGGAVIDIDATSSLTIKEFWGGNDGDSISLNNKGSFTLYYSCRVQGGEGFNMNLYDTGTVTFLDQNHDTSANRAKVSSITAQLVGTESGVQTRQLITLDTRDGKSVSFDGTNTTYSFTDSNGVLMTAVDSLDALATATTSSYYITKDASGIKVSYVNIIPEPTTATLSLLALAGLAARRRRK